MLFILTLFMPFLALGFLFWYAAFRVGCGLMNVVRPFLPIARLGARWTGRGRPKKDQGTDEGGQAPAA